MSQGFCFDRASLKPSFFLLCPNVFSNVVAFATLKIMYFIFVYYWAVVLPKIQGQEKKKSIVGIQKIISNKYV